MESWGLPHMVSTILLKHVTKLGSRSSMAVGKCLGLLTFIATCIGSSLSSGMRVNIFHCGKNAQKLC